MKKDRKPVVITGKMLMHTGFLVIGGVFICDALISIVTAHPFIESVAVAAVCLLGRLI